jgi:chemotaxis protein CheX
LVNVKFLNPFLEAASEVLSADVHVEIKRGSLSLEKSALTSNDVTVMISLIGQIHGVVLYGMSFATGIGIVSQILEQEFAEFDNLAQSGIAELGNVISGRATVKLSQTGFQSTISTPSIIIGKGIQISTLDINRIVVPFSTSLGDIIVHLALREGQSSSD